MPDISIGRLRGGFCVYWREDGQRRRHQLKARTRKEAEAEGIDVYHRHRHQPTDPNIAELLSAYRESLGDRPSGKTLGYIMPTLCNHFGHLRPCDIQRATCSDYVSKRAVEGRSQGTVHTELGYLRSALNFAGLRDAAGRVKRPSKPETDKRILNAGEARALIDATDAPHVRLAVILLLGTAARVGAILDLEWHRVDFEVGSINLRVADSATRKGRAIVPMNAMTRAALQTAHDAALSDYVIEYGGRPVKSIRKGFHNAVKRAGIGHVRIHDIRHTACVTMLQAGHPVHLVAQVLGHSNPRMVEKTYGRFLPQHMAPAVDVLNFYSGPRRA